MEQPLAQAPVRAALYARTARADANAIADQIRACRTAAANRRYEVHDTDVFADDGVSGATHDRPAWRRLLAQVERPGGPEFSVLLVSDRARLGRFVDPRMHSYLIVHLERHGVGVETACEERPHLPPGDGIGAFILDRVGHVAAEHERRERASRMARGRELAQ